MKLNNENVELLLFDLLEGNIPEKDRAALLHQIEENPVWKKEWELLQLTVLEADEELVYEHKSALMKDTHDAKVIVFWPKYGSWVAAASILMAFWFFWSYEHKPQEIVVSKESTPEITKNAPQAEHPKEVQTMVSAEEIHTHVPQVERIVGTPEPLGKKEVIDVKLNEKLLVESIQQVAMTPNTNTFNPVVTLAPTTRILSVSEANESQETTIANVANNEEAGLRGLVNRKLDKALNPFKEPKIAIKRGVTENNPTLFVSFSSKAYSADAQLLLKTN